MKIKIFSRVELANLLISEPNIHDVIIIRAPQENKARPSESDFAKSFREQVNVAFELMKGLWKDHLILEFDDYWKKHEIWQIPTKLDVQKALDYAKDKTDLKIACAGGVSRSSALGYVIARSKLPKEEALKILNIRHHPNDLILELGGQILGQNLKQEVISDGYPLISWG